MKTVYPISEVPHIWAHQKQGNARNSGRNVFFDRDKIYSYGRHFCMGRVLSSTLVLLNDRSYSNTTSKHQSHVRAAVSHMERVFCPFPEDAEIDRSVRAMLKRCVTPLGKLPTARKPEKYIAEIAYELDKIDKYVATMGQDMPTDCKATYDNLRELVASSNLAEWQEARRNGEKQKREAADRVYSRYINDYWRLDRRVGDDFTDEEKRLYTYHHGNSYTHLRIIDGNVETSKGIKLPIDVAKRYLDRYLAGQIAPGDDVFGYKVGSVDEKHIAIGCHHIERSEIDWLKANI